MFTALLGIVELLGIGHCSKSRSPFGVGLRIRTQLPFLLAFFVVGDELNSSEKNACDQDGASEVNTDAPISDAAKSPIIPLTVIAEVASSLENFSSLEDLASAALASPSM